MADLMQRETTREADRMRSNMGNFLADALMRTWPFDIHATVDTLTVTGECTAPHDGAPLIQERFIGHFRRSLQLPVDIKPDDVEASLEGGVLRIEMPKAAAARPRSLKVKPA
ncbi:MAG: Hsp20/alpha crystallin family protein [Thermaerobacterales bacterium]